MSKCFVFQYRIPSSVHAVFNLLVWTLPAQWQFYVDFFGTSFQWMWLFGAQSIECTCSSNLLFHFSLFLIIHRSIKWLWWEWTPFPISKPKAVLAVRLFRIICSYVTGQNIPSEVSCKELVVHEQSGEPKSFVLDCRRFLQTSIPSTESSMVMKCNFNCFFRVMCQPAVEMPLSLPRVVSEVWVDSWTCTINYYAYAVAFCTSVLICVIALSLLI